MARTTGLFKDVPKRGGAADSPEGEEPKAEAKPAAESVNRAERREGKKPAAAKAVRAKPAAEAPADEPDPALREPGTRPTNPDGTGGGKIDVEAPRPDASATRGNEGDDDDNGDTDDDEGDEREEEEEPEEVDADEVHPADDLNDLAASVAAPPRTPSASAPPAPPPEPAPTARPPTLPTRAPAPVVEPATAPKPAVTFDPNKRFCGICGRDVTGLKFCPDDGTPVPQPGQTPIAAAKTPTPVSIPAPVVAPVAQPQPSAQPSMVACENCGYHTAPGRCLNCNHTTGTAPPLKACRSCKQIMPQGRKFCPICTHDQTQLSDAERFAEQERQRLTAEAERTRLEQERQALEAQLAAAKAAPPPNPAPSTPAIQFVKFCHACGAQHRPDGKFCPKCGAPRRQMPTTP